LPCEFDRQKALLRTSDLAQLRGSSHHGLWIVVVLLDRRFALCIGGNDKGSFRVSGESPCCCDDASPPVLAPAACGSMPGAAGDWLLKVVEGAAKAKGTENDALVVGGDGDACLDAFVEALVAAISFVV